MTRGSWFAIAVLTLAYLGLAGVAVADDRFLHDEGLLTHLLASLVGRDPAATLFLQKARPPLALLYSPVAGAGLSAFLWIHVLVCAAAVPLLGATARNLGHERPEIAAAVVALSPMHIAAGAGGLMNADAVVGVALVAWLWSRDRVGAAAVVMGTLVWVRAELAVVALVLVLWGAWRRRPTVLVGIVAFPVAYGIAGALYHADPWWMLHFPPALARPMEGNPYWQSHHAQASLPVVVAALLAVTPAVVLLPLWRRADARPLERAGLLAVGLLAAALLVLPQWQVFNFDLSPRYLLPTLPFVALAVGRVAAAWGPEPAAISGLRRGVGLGLVAAVAVSSERLGGGATALLAVGVAASASALAGAGAGWAARVVLGAMLATGPLGFADGARLARGQQAASLDHAVNRLLEHPEWAGRPVYTNEPLLAAFLERRGILPDCEVRYLVQADQLHELTALSNPANGQREALLLALRQGFYGVPVFPDELRPEAIPVDAVFVLRRDSRLSLVMPAERWSPWLRVEHAEVDVEIAVRVAPGGRR